MYMCVASYGHVCLLKGRVLASLVERQSQVFEANKELSPSTPLPTCDWGMWETLLLG